MRRYSAAALLLLICCATALAQQQLRGFKTLDKDLTMHMVNFRLPDTEGKIHELKDYAGSKAVVLVVQGNGCPIVRQSIPYFEEMKAAYGPKGVTFLYINSNDLDTQNVESIRAEAAEYHATIPILLDADHAVARALHLERTAESFVVDPITWKILYRGMADDRFEYGLQRAAPSRFWLKQVLDDFLAGKKVTTPSTVAKGCLMDLPELRGDVSFDNEVLPILERKCLECHRRSGEKTLTEFNAENQARWLPTLRDVLVTKRMNAEHCGATGKDVELSKPEVQTILGWLAAKGPHSDKQ